jgi:hypothetical protein
MTLRSKLDRLRRDLTPEEEVKLCVHWPGEGCPSGRCGPDTRVIKLMWPDTPDVPDED